MTSVPPKKARSRKRASTSHRVTRSAAGCILLLVAAIATVVLGVFLLSALTPMTDNKHAPAVLVTIPKGLSDHQIGELLARRQLIRKPIGFVLASRLAGLSGKMRAGHYELSPAMPPRQMAVLIELGETANDFITIPEGFTVRQVARRLAKKGVVNEARFLTLCQTGGRSFSVAGWKPPNSNLEGYLFPDTYRIPKGETERQIVTEMLGDFARQALPVYREAASDKHIDLEAAVTLASLVEKEARVSIDRPLIAAALTNRLRSHMKLQCDATIEYVLPEHKVRLYNSDLRVISSYNTYLHDGLPPTPIANPGLPSIRAALNPANVGYLYYVARPDGRHVFSKTLAEHDKAIAEIQKLRAHA